MGAHTKTDIALLHDLKQVINTAVDAKLEPVLQEIEQLKQQLEPVVDDEPEPIIGDDEHGRVLGIDVSFHQGRRVDFQKASDNDVKFCFIRAGSGHTPKDNNFEHNYHEAGAAGLLRGIYWYLYPNNPEKQARDFAAILANKPDAELGAVIDVEYESVTPNIVKRFVNEFQKVEPYGKLVTIYTAAWFWKSGFTNEKWAARHPLWVAHYTSENQPVTPNDSFRVRIPLPWHDYAFWQWSSVGGKLVGHTTKSLDLNYFNGTLSQLRDWYDSVPDFERPLPEPAQSRVIDLLHYMRGDGRLFEIRFPDGSQERNQAQADPDDPNAWYITKHWGGWERWVADDEYIYLDMDTSPAKADDGTARYYKVRENGKLSPICKRYMAIGETFTDGGHDVQFYRKSDCAPHQQNSGRSMNSTQIIALHDRYEFGNGIMLDDVLEILSGAESHLFCPGYGRVGWVAPWGRAELAEIHGEGQRPYNVREVVGCL